MKRKIIALKPWIFWLIYAGVIVACILIDQLTKHFIEIAVKNSEGECIRIIGDWLTLVWTTNPYATGGIFRGVEWSNILFFVMTLVGLPIFGWLLWRSRTRSVWGQVAFAFMIGGTIGNAIDRLFLTEEGGKFFSGAVRDFVQVQNFFGIFNMADSFLVVGVFLALFAIVIFDPDSLVATLIDERKSKLTQQAAQNARTEEAVEQTEKNADSDVTELPNVQVTPAEKSDEDN